MASDTKKIKLVLENGMEFHGKSFGFEKSISGEVVFNTAMTGYQEILTDPSYHEQIITMTYPMIGNYGLLLIPLSGITVFRRLKWKMACTNTLSHMLCIYPVC